jgi:hypothetical protein
MIIPEPTDIKENITPGKRLYRGFFDKKDLIRYRNNGISPDVPLNINSLSPSKIIKLLYGEPQKHIREIEKGRFVSFSFQKPVASYYATDSYKGLGYIAIVEFPDISKAITIDLRGPYMYECTDDTIWIDLRSLLILDAENINVWSRTLVDHELLLLHGVIRPRPTDIIPVRPEDCDRNFRPWKDWGEKIR